MKNILVFPCGSEIGLEIYRSLSFSTHFKLFGGSTVEDHGVYVYDNYIKNIPDVEDDKFIKKINQVIKEYNIDFIIPAHDSVLLKLAQTYSSNQLSCKLITSPIETCLIARSKKRTYNALKGVIKIPKIYNDVDKIKPTDFPIFLKPDVGQGTKGTYLARNIGDITYHINNDPTLLILEYLPGKEYTVDCFTDKHGKLRFAEGRARNRIMNGISVNSTTIDDSRFQILADKINKKLSFRGAWFYQVKENEKNELVLMEVAPRIAGAMGLLRCKGINLPLLSLFDALNYEVDIFENTYKIEMDRALGNRYKLNLIYDHVYLDLDDSVIYQGKVNNNIISFIYQCFNNKIKIHLITRHKGNLDNTLEEYRLQNIFDEKIWIKDNQEKYEFITEPNSIFIDDSFLERKKVYDKLGIAVFDTHMIEALKEKR